jgi:hypothetical protein
VTAADLLSEVRESVGAAALRLAYHAAVPVVVDPALVSLLRANFFLDPGDQVPYEAEAELLLSPLFREIGEGLYEIDPDLRNLLLTGLHTRYGPERFQLIAALLQQYTEAASPWRALPHLETAQRLTAVSFLDPPAAARWLDDSEAGLGTTASDLPREWHVAMRRRLEEKSGIAAVGEEIRRAVSLIEGESQEGRLDGLDALCALARLPEANPDQVVALLVYYLNSLAGIERDHMISRARADVQKALTVIGSLPHRTRFILSGIILAGVTMAGLDFSGMSFTNVDLVDADAARANFTNTLFRDVTLRGVVLDRARLDGAELHFGHLRNVSMRGVSAEGARMEAVTAEDVIATDASGNQLAISIGPPTEAGRGAGLEASPSESTASQVAPRKVSAFAVESGAMLADRYRLTEKLGSGSAGEVWKGHDVRLDRNVAIKVLIGERPGSTMIERFRREAALASAVQHPGITVLYDVGVQRSVTGGRHEERRFIVTELLIGQDLAGVLKDNPAGLPIERVIDLGIQLAGALAATHAANIIHRDLKPSNLFVMDGDRLKICDFGIAGDMSPDALATRITTAFIGPPYYMSPEQWDGRAPSSGMDLYAVGCILYEMLTGRVPFEGNSLPDLMRQHTMAAPIPPRNLKPSVPDALNDLTLSLLAKDPADRPDSARAVAIELQGIRNAMEATAAEAALAAEARTALARAEVVAMDAQAAFQAAREAQARAMQIAEALADAEARAARAEAALAATQGHGSLSAFITAPLACASLSTGHFEIFILDGSGSLQHRTWSGTGWDKHQGIGLPEGHVTAITAGTRQGQRVLIAVADGIPHIKEWFYQQGRVLSWADWEPVWDYAPHVIPADAMVDVAIASPGTDELNVFALDSIGRIWRSRRQTRRQAGWTDSKEVTLPPAWMPTAITALAYKERSLCLAIAVNSQVHARMWHQKEGWNTWRALGPLPAPGTAAAPARVADIACLSPAPGLLDVFALDGDGGISQCTWSDRANAWSDWVSTPAPGDQAIAITATSLGRQRQAIAAISRDGNVGYVSHYAEVTRIVTGQPRWSSWS